MTFTGKEAVIALLTAGDFLGEGCISSGARVRMATATTMARTTAVKIKKDEMIGVLHERTEFADLFITYMLKRNVGIEADLMDQLFNSSEKRWAVLFCCWRVMEKKASLNQSLAKYQEETFTELVGHNAQSHQCFHE